MTFFLCKLWPYLAGGLIGWLLAGWFARRFKHSEPAIERVVEKEVERVVDNPEHLALIGKLEGENKQLPDLLAKVASFKSAKAKTVEKVVEVDSPALLARIKKLEGENKTISALQGKIKALEGSEAKVVEKKVVVEKLIDNPDHLRKISDLEKRIAEYQQGPVIDLKAARAAGISIKDENDLTAIEGIGPKINDLIKADGIQTFASLADTDPAVIQKTLDNAGSRYTMANPGTWPDQANLATNNRWPALKALQDVLIGGVYPDASSSGSASSVEKLTAESASTTVKLDIDAAKVAGFNVKQKNGQDDFTLIEGIGPKINELIHAANIHTFAELGSTKVEIIQKILDKAGSKFALAKPGTWPAQSDMAASNRWAELKAWQDELDGGV